MGEVILTASGNGGVGKTVITANLGGSIAREGASVILVDMNIGLRSLDICLGLENRIVYDLTDVITGTCRLKQALIRDRRFPELYLMSAPQDRRKGTITQKEMGDLCRQLKERYDYVLIDAPSGIGKGLEICAGSADQAVIITVPGYAALRDADLLNDALHQLGVNERSLVVNKIIADLYQKGIVPDPVEIGEKLRLAVSGLVPFDLNIHVSSNIGVPIVLAKDSYIAGNFARMAERLLSKKGERTLAV